MITNLAALTPDDVRIVIQARMSSTRFPGKSLAPFQGRPLIAHVLERASRILGQEHVVLATSDETSDEPLSIFVEQLGHHVYRGSLTDVHDRFRSCLAMYPTERFVRICADSPLLDPELARHCIGVALGKPQADIVTNVHPRSWPRGQSVEVVRVESFASLDSEILDDAGREHVTRPFYDDPQAHHIINVTSKDVTLASRSMTIDTIDDLQRVATEAAASPFRFNGSGQATEVTACLNTSRSA